MPTPRFHPINYRTTLRQKLPPGKPVLHLWIACEGARICSLVFLGRIGPDETQHRDPSVARHQPADPIDSCAGAVRTALFQAVPVQLTQAPRELHYRGDFDRFMKQIRHALLPAFDRTASGQWRHARRDLNFQLSVPKTDALSN